MDLSNFDLRSRTAVLELKNPLNGEVIRHDDGRPFSITLRSRDHADVVKTTDAMLSDVMRGLKPDHASMPRAWKHPISLSA